MKIYDCFTFYNEFELLELRLKALWDVVDYFVIVEANMKHNGEPKEFNFPKRAEEYAEFFPKIRYLFTDLTKVPFKGTGDWSIEHAQRNAIMNGIGDAEPESLIMISDVDEIPNPEVLTKLSETELVDRKDVTALELLKRGGEIALTQEFFYYYFDLISKKTWQGTTLIKRKYLKTPQHLRNRRNKISRIAGGGWHFSYMGGVDRVINKMTSIVDGNELVVKSGGKFLDREHIEKAMANGIDVYGRNIVAAQFVPYDARNIRLPHIDEFLKKYPHFLREPEKYFVD